MGKEDAVAKYLSSFDKNLKSLKAFPEMQKVYRKMNTGMPSSASEERLFSQGSLVFGQKRQKLLDSNLEKHSILNANPKFMK